MLHQGIGVLKVWDVAETQLRQSRREVGKYLPALPALEARVPWQRTFIHSNPQGALGCLPGRSRHLQKISSKKQEQPPCEVRPLPVHHALASGRKGRQSSTKTPALTHSSPPAFCSEKTDISQAYWVSAPNVAASHGLCQVSGRPGLLLSVCQAVVCGCHPSGLWWPRWCSPPVPLLSAELSTSVRWRLWEALRPHGL